MLWNHSTLRCQQPWLDHETKSYPRGNRVARQPKNWTPLDMAISHWLARLDSQLPQRELSVLFDLRTNVIFLPHRHATGSHDTVCKGGGVSQGLSDLGGIIALGFQQDWLASQGLDL